MGLEASGRASIALMTSANRNLRYLPNRTQGILPERCSERIQLSFKLRRAASVGASINSGAAADAGLSLASDRRAAMAH
jgi:hypothetical protein